MLVWKAGGIADLNQLNHKKLLLVASSSGRNEKLEICNNFRTISYLYNVLSDVVIEAEGAGIMERMMFFIPILPPNREHFFLSTCILDFSVGPGRFRTVQFACKVNTHELSGWIACRIVWLTWSDGIVAVWNSNAGRVDWRRHGNVGRWPWRNSQLAHQFNQPRPFIACSGAGNCHLLNLKGRAHVYYTCWRCTKGHDLPRLLLMMRYLWSCSVS